MNLNIELFTQTSTAAAMVIFGVVTKNTLEQLGFPNHVPGKMIGMGLFIIGWILTAYALSNGKDNKLMYYIPSALIVGTVMMMKKSMAEGKKPPIIFPILFAGAWLMLGYYATNHLPNEWKYIGLLASGFVLLSMLITLPWQRENNIVDGPGMPLFIIAWGILVIANSLR
jgi:hypothetical protein